MVRTFGEIPGVPEGTSFPSRAALNASRVHGPTQGGISGSETEGADSIVVSGGYEDDEDYGDVIVYTGHGGRDSATGKQIRDQELARGNPVCQDDVRHRQ
jgi:putative restriction endonuclease